MFHIFSNQLPWPQLPVNDKTTEWWRSLTASIAIILMLIGRRGEKNVIRIATIRRPTRIQLIALKCWSSADCGNIDGGAAAGKTINRLIQMEIILKNNKTESVNRKAANYIQRSIRFVFVFCFSFYDCGKWDVYDQRTHIRLIAAAEHTASIDGWLAHTALDPPLPSTLLYHFFCRSHWPTSKRAPATAFIFSFAIALCHWRGHRRA